MTYGVGILIATRHFRDIDLIEGKAYERRAVHTCKTLFFQFFNKVIHLLDVFVIE